MTHTSSENRLDLRTQLRGGTGEIKMYHLLEENELMGKAKMCTRLVVEPGCSIGSHPHNPEAEIYYIIKGELEMDDDGVIRQMHAGDIMITGNGAMHGLNNKSDKTAEVFAIILA